MSELAAGSGPFALDAERAGGYRYSQRAYLVQIHRPQAGTFLIDPLGVGPTDALARVLATDEWILHAASQDLPCLHELGLSAPRLFDTELAARLLGRPHVGLGALVEEMMDIHLAKEYSAVDWSTRPMPSGWLDYAALDVAYLHPLRRALHRELDAAGKLSWATQEFEHERLAPPPPARPEPWRRTSQITRARTPRQLAVVRALWQERDAIARELDRAPGKVLNDRALVALAAADPLPPALPARRELRAHYDRWQRAYREALDLDDAALPRRRSPRDGALPDPRNWKHLNPEAAERLPRVRSAVAELAQQLVVPQENLLQPQLQRLAAWEVDQPQPQVVAAVLRQAGARPWQVQLTAPVIAAALAEP